MRSGRHFYNHFSLLAMTLALAICVAGCGGKLIGSSGGSGASSGGGGGESSSGGGAGGGGGAPGDVTAPTAPSILINGTAAETNFRAVTLTLDATEADSLPMEMCISESATCAGCVYEAFSASKAFTLSAAVPATKTVGVMFKDAAGNETACVTDDIDYTTTITVVPRFTNAPNWNDYVRRCTGGTNTCSGIEDGVTACTGAESGGATACIHGGDRKVVVTSETSCTGLTMTDTLGAFDWTCVLNGSIAEFRSALKTTKGLADLVTHGDPLGSWTNNSVTLTKGAVNVTSTAAAWWTNLVHSLPDNSAACPAPGADTAWTCPGVQNTVNLALASTIYTLGASRSTRGYNLNAHKIAVVTMGDTTVLTAGTSGNNCNATTFETAAGTRCLLAAGTQNFLWIEGRFQGHPTVGKPGIGIGLKSVTFSQIRRASVGITSAASLRILAGTNYNRISQFRATASDSEGIYMFASGGAIYGNIFSDVSVTSAGIANFFAFKDSDYNVFNGILSSNGSGAGINFRGDAFEGDGDSKMNIFSRVTANNARGPGMQLNGDISTVPDNVIHNAVFAGNGDNDYAVSLAGVNGSGFVTRPTLSQIVVASNTNTSGGLSLQYVESAKITGNLLVGNNATANCDVVGGTTPGLQSDCDPDDSSNHNLVSGVDLSTSFILRATSDATNSEEDVLGQSTGNLINAPTPSNWFNFDNFFRFWGADNGDPWPMNGLTSPCFHDGSTCQIFDYSLDDAVSIIRNKSGDGATANAAFSAGAACPAQVAGTQFLTTQTYTYDASFFAGINGIETAGGDADGVCEAAETCVQRYLKAASEIIDDLSGDDDGLCETGEACLYNPNFGVYQGHGTLSSCTFSNGTITGVTMYGYGTNGN